MRSLLRTGALLALIFVLPVAAQEKKADPKSIAKDKKQAEDKLATAEEITGRLADWGEGDKKTLVVSVPIRYPEINQGAARELTRLQLQLAQINANPQLSAQDKANQMQNTRIEMARQQANLYTPREEWKKLEFALIDEVKVRLNNPPVALDAKGNIKQPTRKELDELKGPDKKLPGYTGTLDNLQNNQTVKVFLAKQKKPVKSKDVDPAAKREVALILVLSDPPPAK